MTQYGNYVSALKIKNNTNAILCFLNFQQDTNWDMGKQNDWFAL